MTAIETTDVQDTFGQDMTPDDWFKRFINGRSYFGRKYFNIVVCSGLNGVAGHTNQVQL